MLFKFFSENNITINEAFRNSFRKISNQKGLEKFFLIFWFSGPIFYLIERDPADFWLSTICISFLIRSFFKQDWEWTNQTWVKSVFVFWIWCLISSILSPDPLFSFQQAVVWIRFPIYAMAVQAWLGSRKDFRELMLVFIALGMFLMNLILISEMILEPKHRLSWPYGDLVPGGYLGKFCLPVTCFLAAYIFSVLSMKSLIAGVFFLMTLIVTMLTGERVSFLILTCGSIMTALIWKPKLLNTLGILILIKSSIIVFLIAKPSMISRYTYDFLDHNPILNTEGYYWGSWRSGIQQAFETPFKGIGASGTRKTCKELPVNTPNWLPGKNYCGNHPHNFYIQLLAETGIIGFLLGCFMFFSIIKTCFIERKNNPKDFLCATAFVIPFAFFFPLQNTNSFFGQWGNLFTWFAIGFSMSSIQSFRKVSLKND